MAPKSQIFIITSGFILIVLLFAAFIIIPLFNTIKDESQEVVSQRNNAFMSKSQSEQAKNFEKNYEVYRPNLEKIETLFVDSQNPVDFIEFLEKSASVLGGQVQISTPSFYQEGISKVGTFNLSFVGDFSNAVKFLRQLEFGPFLISMKSLNMENHNDLSQKQDNTNKTTKKIQQTTVSIKVLAK
jgi:hypothetical protein